ncbi:MAG: NAD-binding protein [Ignavibacteriales bacterium]|nr:NAD-binding protein [Ignavibacteriales bacterium]
MDVQAADSAAAVADGAGIIFLCLFDSSAVHAVLTQEKGLLSGEISGKIIVDFSTNHFAEVTAFHELCSRAGVELPGSAGAGERRPCLPGRVDRPGERQQGGIRGGETGPGAGGQAAVLSGKARPRRQDEKADQQPGPGELHGHPCRATLVFGEEVGVGKQEVLDILQAGAGSSMVLNAKKDKLLTEDFSAHFSNALIYKDLHCLQDLAYELKKPLLTGSAVQELFARTYGAGLEERSGFFSHLHGAQKG